MTSMHRTWCATALARTAVSTLVSEPSRYSSSWNRLELIAPIRTPRSAACAASLPKSSTTSQGMCSETRGATPVNVCTWAASSSFSKGFRATPGCPNTLKRVPELPNAQDGSSMVCSARFRRARARRSVLMSAPVRGVNETFHYGVPTLGSAAGMCQQAHLGARHPAGPPRGKGRARRSSSEREVVDVRLVEHLQRAEDDLTVLADGVVAELAGG